METALNNRVKRRRAVLDWGILGHCETARGRHACPYICVCTLRALTMGSPVGVLIPACVRLDCGNISWRERKSRERIGKAAATGREDKQSWLYCCFSAILSAVHAMPLSASRQCWLAFKVSYTRVRASLSLFLARGSVASNCRERRTDVPTRRSRAGDRRGQVSPFIGAPRRTFIRNRWTHCLP